MTPVLLQKTKSQVFLRYFWSFRRYIADKSCTNSYCKEQVIWDVKFCEKFALPTDPSPYGFDTAKISSLAETTFGVTFDNYDSYLGSFEYQKNSTNIKNFKTFIHTNVRRMLLMQCRKKIEEIFRFWVKSSPIQWIQHSVTKRYKKFSKITHQQYRK